MMVASHFRPTSSNLVNLVWRKSQQTKKDSAAAKKKEKVGAKDGENETSLQNLVQIVQEV